MNLIQAIDVHKKDIIALVGGGEKSMTLYVALANELAPQVIKLFRQQQLASKSLQNAKANA